MATLPVDFLDDILNASMNGKRKYRITHADGSTEEVIIDDISEYDQVGDNFGAAQVNQTNEAVNEKLESADVVDPMVATEEGFAADALAVKNQFDEQNKNITETKIKISNARYLKSGDSVIIEFYAYSTACLIYGAMNEKSFLYIYSNGYLNPIVTHDNISVSLDSTFEKITVKNNHASSATYLGILQSGNQEISWI